LACLTRRPCKGSKILHAKGIVLVGVALTFRFRARWNSQTPYELAWIAAIDSSLLLTTDPRDKVYSLLGIGLGNRIPQVPTWGIDWNSIYILDFLDFPTIVNDAFYSADTGMTNPSHRAKIKGQMLKVFGTLCGEINAIAPFPGTLFENATEAFHFDMTVGQDKEHDFDPLIQPGIPRVHASFRLCLDDMDVSRKHHFELSEQYAKLFRMYLMLLEESPEHAKYSYHTRCLTKALDGAIEVGRKLRRVMLHDHHLALWNAVWMADRVMCQTHDRRGP
jgi:hypothetical protein